jgi:hypothetical protein
LLAGGAKLDSSLADWVNHNRIIWASFGGKKALYSVVKNAAGKDIAEVLVNRLPKLNVLVPAQTG